MYNPLLDTFMAVIDCGSFTKAAEKLFISSTAVMKQINTLENDLNLKLTVRTPSGVNDFIRNDLEKNHPQIHIEDTPQFHDLSVFNRCAETGNVLLTIECWAEVHPGLVSIPVNWDYSIPYGLLYSLDSDPDVLKLVEEAKKIASV